MVQRIRGTGKAIFYKTGGELVKRLRIDGRAVPMTAVTRILSDNPGEWWDYCDVRCRRNELVRIYRGTGVYCVTRVPK